MHASASQAPACPERCWLRGVDRHARALHHALVAGRFRAGEHAFSDELTLGRDAHMFYSHRTSVAHSSTICQAVRLCRTR
jgi:hypothetical protein